MGLNPYFSAELLQIFPLLFRDLFRASSLTPYTLKILRPCPAALEAARRQVKGRRNVMKPSEAQR